MFANARSLWRAALGRPGSRGCGSRGSGLRGSGLRSSGAAALAALTLVFGWGSVVPAAADDLAALQPLPAETVVRLRPDVIVDADVVTLGDVFALPPQAAALADRPLAQAPAPGRAATVTPAWLAAAAARLGVDWTPPPALKRVRVVRASRTVPASALEALIAEALTAREGGSWFVRLSDPRDRHAPMDAALAPRVLALEADPSGGRVEAAIALTADGDPQPVAARAEPGVTMWAPRRAIARGAIVREGDLHAVAMPASRAPRAPLDDPAAAIGRAATRPLRADQPLSERDVATPPAIRRGETVTLLYQHGRLSLSLRARALEDAAAGAVARFQNLESSRVLDARVTGPGRAVVAGPNPAARPYNEEAS